MIIYVKILAWWQLNIIYINVTLVYLMVVKYLFIYVDIALKGLDGSEILIHNLNKVLIGLFDSSNSDLYML